MLTNIEVIIEMIKKDDVEEDATEDDRKNRQNVRHLKIDYQTYTAIYGK